MSVRSDLRAQVFEIAGGRCEHPKLYLGARYDRCDGPAVELAHIVPRGMGHTGYRDHLTNVMAACTLHARSTDDLSDPAWQAVPDAGDAGGLRVALAYYVNSRRRREGVDLEAS